MPYKLVCFDLDGTLIENVKHAWQLFHDAFDTDIEKREEAKTAFLNGDISYDAWAQHDVALWKEKRMKRDDFLRAADSVTLIPGALETLHTLKEQGIKLALISGSIDIVLEKAIPSYQELFDDIFINTLTFDRDGVIVDVTATKYDVEKKAHALELIADREQIEVSECVFVGDYLNDIKIIELAGLGIAFNCEHDEVKAVADIVIEQKDLKEILPHILEK